MKFKRVQNMMTNNISYFVNGKKVTSEQYEYYESLANIKGLAWNSLRTEVKGHIAFHYANAN